jgi:hypothetical protein
MELTRALYSACSSGGNQRPDLRSEVVYFFSMALGFFWYKQLKEAQQILREFIDLGVRGYFDITGPAAGNPREADETARENDEAAREHCRGLFRDYLKQLTSGMDQLAALSKKDAEAAEQAQLAFVIRRLMEFHVERFERLPPFEMIQRAGAVIFRIAPRLVYEYVVVASQQVSIDLPETWKPTQGSPQSYQDPATPQYNFMVSALPPAQAKGSPIEILKRVLAGNQTLTEVPRLDAVGPARAIAQYRTALPEPEQHHWMVVDVEAGAARTALFTFSVLVGQADGGTTARWVRTLRERIERARFPAVAPRS